MLFKPYKTTRFKNTQAKTQAKKTRGQNERIFTFTFACIPTRQGCQYGETRNQLLNAKQSVNETAAAAAAAHS